LSSSYFGFGPGCDGPLGLGVLGHGVGLGDRCGCGGGGFGGCGFPFWGCDG